MARQNTARLATGASALRRDIGQCRQIGRAWRSQARSTGLVRSTRTSRISAFFAGPVRSYAPPFCSRMNLTPRSCGNTLRGSMTTGCRRAFAAAIETGEPKVSSVGKPFKRDNGLWRGLSRGPTSSSRGCAGSEGLQCREFRRRRRMRDRANAFRAISVRDRAYSGRAAGISCRPVPGWAEKRQHGASDLAQKRNKNGCGERGSRHVTLHAMR